MNLARSSLKIFIARIIKAASSFLAIIIFSRQLGADPLGTYYPFLALLGIIALPGDLGVSEATTKRISENKERSSFLGAAITLKFPIVFVIGLAVLTAREQVNQFLGADLAVLLVITLYVSSIGGLSMSVLKGELRVGETAALEILPQLSWLVVGYFFISQGYGVHGLVYGYLFGVVLQSIVGWLKVSISVARPTLDHIRSLFGYAKFSAVSSIGGTVYSWADVAVLSAFVALGYGVTRGEIGAYENAWQLSLILMLVGRSISTTLFPQISRWDTEDAKEKIESAIPTALFPSLLIVIPGIVGTIILSEDLLRVLFGPEFTVAWVALMILVVAKIPMSLHILLSKALNAIDRPDLAAIAATISAVLNLLLNVVLIWQYGIVGAAIGTTTSFMMNTLLHAYFLNQFLEIRLPLFQAGWSIIASVAMGIFVFVVRSTVEPTGMLSLLGIVLLGTMVYFPILLLYKPVRTETQRIGGRLIPNVNLKKIFTP